MNESPQNENAASLPGPAANERHTNNIPQETAPGNAPKIKSEHDYKDYNGETLFRAVLLEDGQRLYQRRDPPASDWIDGLAGIRVLPYNWLSIHDKQVVSICRDEAEADLLASFALDATALPDGIWTPDLAPHFKGKTVLLWAGQTLSASPDMRRGLAAAGVKVKRADVPQPYPTLAAWLTKEPPYEAVEDAIDKATDLPPPTTAPAFRPGGRTTERPVFTTPEPPMQAPEPWGEALPMAAAGEIDPFPVEHLPPALQAMARAVSETMGVPVEFPAVFALVIAGTAMGNKLRVEIKAGAGGHWQFGNLYGMLASPPATGKTPPFAPMTAPLRQWESAALADYERRLADWKAQTKQIEAQITGLEKKLEKSTDPADLQRHTELTLERQVLGEAPPEPRLFSTDSTSEKLARRMAGNGEAFAMIASEGRKLLEIAGGRYTGGADIDLWLAGHAGDHTVIDRQGSPSVILGRPCLSAFVAVQPDALQRLGENPALRDSGFLARWLYLQPSWPLRGYAVKSIDDATMAHYCRVITTLLAWPCTRDQRGVPEPQTVRLSPAAGARWVEFTDGIRATIHEASTTMPVSLQSWLGKLAETVARIALIMHTVEAVEHGGELAPISIEVMDRAAEIGACLFGHAKRAFAVIGEDADAVLCRRSWKWANDNRAKLREMREGQGLGRIEAIKPNDLTRHGIANDAKAATRALDQLEARGWLQAVEWDNPQAPNAKRHVFYFLRPMEATP